MRDGGQPDSLAEMELELEQQEIVRPAVAVKVQAWVRYGNVPVRVDAEAVAWTQFAVDVRWQGPDTANPQSMGVGRGRSELRLRTVATAKTPPARIAGYGSLNKYVLTGVLTGVLTDGWIEGWISVTARGSAARIGDTDLARLGRMLLWVSLVPEKSVMTSFVSPVGETLV